MRDKTNANGAGEARGCVRGEQLLAYLYGESSPEESADFRRHLMDCLTCSDELAAFGDVRAGVGEWREEVMRSIPALNISGRAMNAPVASNASAVKTETRAKTRTRSASAALREFFSLSPLWLRAATVAAAVVFCALAALTLARAEVRWDSDGFAFNTGVKERVVEKQIQAPAPNGFTQEQVDAIVRQNVEREVAAAEDRLKAEQAARANVVNAGGVVGERRASPSRNANGAATQKNQQSPRRSTRGEQLADREDIFYPGEESVPRLTDILGAVKSQSKENER